MSGTGEAHFTARVQGVGRIAIPKPSRDASGIDKGDLVEVIIKVTRKAGAP